MAKKKSWKIFSTIKQYLTPLQSSQSDANPFYIGPTLEPYSTERHRRQSSNHVASRFDRMEPIPSDKEVERINRDRLESEKLIQAHEEMERSREALNLTLKSQQRLLVATMLATLVALIVGIISLFNKPPVVNIIPPAMSAQQSNNK